MPPLKHGMLFILLVSSTLAFAAPKKKLKLKNTYHLRSERLKIDFNPKVKKPKKMKDIELAIYYLNKWLEKNKLHINKEEFEIKKVQHSLLAKHYHFQQYLYDTEIEGAEIIVSLDHQKNKLIRVFNNAAVPKSVTIEKTNISKEEAFDIAWKALGVQGKLLGEPQIDLFYFQEEDQLRLAYKVGYYTSNPHGVWQIKVDAKSGKVVEIKDAKKDLKEHKTYTHIEINREIKTNNRKKEFQNYLKRKKDNKIKSPKLVDGLARVFDPDPRSGSFHIELSDDDPVESFDESYVVRKLRDITLVNGSYKLRGPWVTIADFDYPDAKPVETKDGIWFFNRGHQGFNDAMTYFHIDQSQRYMQSLGFKDKTGIQHRSINIDTNGAGGADNSYFSLIGNSLSFGHGCADDNEDADVILHEYGHAINHDINKNFEGGDSGAMGEGFGDYWAASYSISVSHNPLTDHFQVFNWDGPPCWRGRRLDAFNTIYDHYKTYWAHSGIQNGISDELWSTPLFQGLVTLVSMGYKREEVDRIILEAQFGLGYGLKMRDMALAIVDTAQRMYPKKPHAIILKEKFMFHRILTEEQFQRDFL